MRRKVLARSVRSAVEALESRTLLSSTLAVSAGTASISGVVYTDVNGNGVRDTGEQAIGGATVTIQRIGTVYAPGTIPTVQTDGLGGFYFTGLAAGQYDVNVVPQAGYVQDSPGTTFVTVSTNDTVSIAVGESNTPTSGSGMATITGTLFNDVTGAGVYQPTNNPNTQDFLAGDAAYLDFNGTGTFAPNDPFTTTNNIGQYTFSVPPGSYQVRAIPRPGFHQDGQGYSQVTVYSDQTVTQNIGENNRAMLSGNVFVDANGTGVQDPGELPVVGETVFLDQNFSGVFTPGTYNPTSGGFDNGDPYSTTDPNGFYNFTGLKAGTYRIEVVSAAGLIQDSPGFIDVTISTGQSLVHNIGEGARSSFSGTVFNDRNGNGTKVPGDEGLPNQVVYLDSNTNGVYDKVGFATDGLPLNGPSVTYTIPISTLLTLDSETTTLTNIASGDTAEMVLAAGNTTILSSLAASSVPVSTTNSTPALGLGPAGKITSVTPLSATVTVIPVSSVSTSLMVSDVSTFDNGSGGGFGPNMVSGTVVGINPAANTITLSTTTGTTTYTLAAGATVSLDGTPTLLKNLNLGTVTVQLAEPVEVTDVNGNFTFPNLGPGKYTARVVVPPGATQTGPGNSAHSFSFTVTSGQTIMSQNFGLQTPDLTCNIVNFPTAPTLTDVAKKARVRVTNVGSLSASGLVGVTLWAQTSSGPVDPSKAYIVGTIPGNPIRLNIGQSKIYTVNFSYPTNLPLNSYYVSAQVVSSVHDNNSSNDFSPPVGPVKVGPPYIDLSASFYSNPAAQVDAGGSTSINLLVSNLGNVATTGPAYFRIYTTVTPTIEPTDMIVESFTVKNVRILPGRSKVFTVTVPFPGQNLGLRYIDAEVVSGDPLGEMNLANNVAIAPTQTLFN